MNGLRILVPVKQVSRAEVATSDANGTLIQHHESSRTHLR